MKVVEEVEAVNNVAVDGKNFKPIKNVSTSKHTITAK